MSEIPYVTRHHRHVPHPGHFYIDIGNVCNLRCPFCATGSGQAKHSPALMSLDQYQNIFGKIRHSAQLIGLYNWGEPLLNSALADMVTVTTDHGIKAHIDTNLSLKSFNRHAAERLVRSRLSSLFVSLDGATQAAYEKYRVRGRIDLVFRNLETLLQAKRDLRSDLPFVGWQYYVHAYNEADMPEARRIAAQLGVPISFKRLSTPLADWKSSFHQNDDMYIEHDPAMASVYVAPVAPEYADIQLHPSVPSPCRQMFTGTMTINANGDVYPCTCVEGPQFSLGNLLRTSLDEVWNGQKFGAARGFLEGFGPVQNSGSPCEKYSCPMRHKSAVEPLAAH